MNIKNIYKRLMSIVLTFILITGCIGLDGRPVLAATTSVYLTSLGSKGTVKIGSKTKSGTWWQMNLDGKKAFCLDLGYTCHDGNTYKSVETKNWDQGTGGEKNGYYAKIIRWYVVDKNRSTKGFVMAQALIWSIANGRNSKSQLKDVIEQVQKNISISPGKTVEKLYSDIFEPSGDWTAQVTYWEKTGNSKSYQKLMTVDADETEAPINPKSVSTMWAYRQRVTLHKADESGTGLSGIQFTLTAHNIDELYSFAMTDLNGYTGGTADEEDTDFSLTGLTNNDGNIGFRMTYRLYSMKYYYFPDDDLANMSDDTKKEAKKYLTDTLELDEGVDFPADLKKSSAEKLMNKEMEKRWTEISNSYTLTEDNTGSHTDLMIDPQYANGYDFVINTDKSWMRDADNNWPDMQITDPASYDLAYRVGVTNYKKRASVKVVKIDKYSSDKKPHGEASLDGATFTLCSDAEGTKIATVYDASGNEISAGTYTVKDGRFSTDYLKSGETYYLSEVSPPKGYTLSNDVLPITVDATGTTAEYTSDIAAVEYGNQPILGKVAVQKYYSDGGSGTLEPESGTTFQVYLKSKGSYDKCDDYERATIKTDANGYGVTRDLYIGKYIVHQVDSGDVDAIPVKDFDVDVTEDGKTYTFPLNNKLFKAFLRIIKKDGNTEKTVLKAGTTYQIYKVTGDKEELVEQSYADGNKMVRIDKFVTDETGEIMTVQALRSATYRIYEVDSASGLHKTEKYIEVTINSKADNYEGYIDEDGNSHAIITLTYTNKETFGKIKIYKTGQMLTGYENGKFVYENRYLKGAVFEVYAAEDIATQDNQGTNWYDKDELVATITTGDGAEFTKECKDITGQSIDENGVISITVPLGKYHVKEVKTPYGYIISDKEWDVDFTWDNYEDEFVINNTKASDDMGVINAVNALAKTQVSLLKKDEKDEKPVQGAVFGLYTKDDIYNVFGEKIVDAGTQLASVTTNASGIGTCNLQLPIMSENYGKADQEKNGEDKTSENKDNTSFADKAEASQTNEADNKAEAQSSTNGTDNKTEAQSSTDDAGGKTEAQSITDGTDNKTETTDNKDEVKAEPTAEGKSDKTLETDNNSSEKGETVNKDTKEITLNSGDYYLKEISISGSYYMRNAEYPVHLEYKDQNTNVVAANVEAVNTHTVVTVSKLDITGSKEVQGCDLEIRDKEDNVIIKWTSGVHGTTRLSEKLGELGYRNVTAYQDEKGNQQISGLLHDEIYTLTEKRPADGYVTSGDIKFKLAEGEDSRTIVCICEGEEFKPKTDNIVLMYDDTTKIRLLKLASDTGEGLAKAKFEVYDSEKNKVFEFETSDEGYDVTGILAVGKTYTFKEVEAPQGYKLAKPVEYTILDTAEVQQIIVKDEKKPKPKVPQTGGITLFAISLFISVIILIGGLWYYLRERGRHEKRR